MSKTKSRATIPASYKAYYVPKRLTGLGVEYIQPLMINSGTLIEKLFGQIPRPIDSPATADELIDCCEPAHSALIMRCEYTVGIAHHSISILPSSKFFASGFSVRQISLFSIGLGDPRAWLREVRGSGMEVVGGRLVLARLDADADAATVLIIEQGRGCSIVPAVARITRRPAGGWELATQPDRRNPAIALLCSKQPGRGEVTDELWAQYLTRRVEINAPNLGRRLCELWPLSPKRTTDDDAAEVGGDYLN